MRLFIALFFLSIINVSIASTSFTSIFNPDIDDQQKWQVHGEGYDMKTIPWPDMVPGKALQISFPAATRKNQWPTATLKNPGSPSDWLDFESLDFDFFIEGKDAVPLKIYFKTTDRVGRIQLNLKPGRSTTSISKNKIVQLIDCSKLKELRLYFSNPTRKYTINLGSIRLTKVNRNVFIAQSKAELKLLLKKYAKGKTKFNSKQEKAKFDNQMIRLKRLLENPQDAGSNFTEYKAKCEKTYNNLNILLQRAFFRAQAGDKDMTWIWNSPMSKVLLNGDGLGSYSMNRTISLAKGEAEGATLIIFPLRDLQDVTWEVDKFTSSDGQVLSSDNINISPCGYIKCQTTPYMRQNNVYRPDPILTYCNKLNINKLTYQSFYVEVSSTLKQNSGIFNGKIIFRSQDKVLAQIPLQIEIWNFSLKPGSLLPVAVSWREPYQSEMIPSIYITDPIQKQEYINFVEGKITLDKIKGQETLKAITIRQKLIDMLLDHRLSPDSLYRKYPPSISELKYITSRGARYFNISYSPTILPQILKDNVALYRENNLLDKAYIYLYDEADSRLWPQMKEKIREIKKVNADIPIITTAYDHTFGKKSKLEKMVDVWVVPLNIYHINLEAINKARNTGENIWWYVACGPFAPYPNFFIEYPSIGQRLLTGIMSQKFNNQGFLYYSLMIWKDFWLDSNKKWHCKFKTEPMNGAPIVTYNAYSYKNFNGDGNLIYPGPHGAIPSLRLKQFRDGLEDYQYIEFLKDIISNTEDKNIKDKGEKILNSAYSLINDDFSCKKDTTKFEAVRSSIGAFVTEHITKYAK